MLYVNRTVLQSASAFIDQWIPMKLNHFSGASSKENHASRYNSSSLFTSMISPLKNPIRVSRKHGKYSMRGSCIYSSAVGPSRIRRITVDYS
jgi:hypothetical protein